MAAEDKLTTRSTKGSALTHAEMDANLLNLTYDSENNFGGMAPETTFPSGSNNNIAIGKDVLTSINGGDQNIAIGNLVAQHCVTGVSGTFIGNLSGQRTTGSSTVNVGRYAGGGTGGTNYSNTNNVSVGALAGLNNTSYDSVSVGASAGYAPRAIWRTVSLGYLANYNLPANRSYSVALGYYALNTASNQLMLGRDASGQGIERISGPQCGLTVSGNNLTMSGNVTAYSDVRLKRDIEKVDGIETIKKLRGVEYEKNNLKEWQKGSGVIAQEIQKVLPHLVIEEDDNKYLAVAYDGLSAYFIEAIKELSDKVESLQSEIEELKNGSS